MRVAIVGAGISGMACAYHLLKTARRLNRAITVVIFEKLDCPGGTWSRSNVYPGLVTNNTWDQMLFDDAAQRECERIFEEDEGAVGGLGNLRASGEGMVKIMEKIAEQVLTLGAEVRYSTRIEACRQHRPGHWEVTSAPNERPLEVKTEEFDKLVVATGTFSTPAVPSFAKAILHPQRKPITNLKGPMIIHTSHLSDDSVQKALYARQRHIAIVGGSKSALDAAERLATAGQKVSLILRNPPYTAPPFGGIRDGKYLSFVANVGSRFKLSQVPYFRDPISGKYSTGGLASSLYRWFLHYTSVGARYCERLFRISTHFYSMFNQWGKPMSNIMTPIIPLKWSESSTYPGSPVLPELIQTGKVVIVRGGLTSMQPSALTDDESSTFNLSITRSEGGQQEFPVDCVIFGTGWATGEYPFFTREQLDDLGLPISYTEDKPPLRESQFAESDRIARERINKEIKTMQDPPSLWSKAGYSARSAGRAVTSFAPYRLYRLLVPLSHLDERDIAFPGIPTNKANHVVFMVQAHWISDYFFELLPRLPSYEKAREEISTHVQWSWKLFGPAHGLLGQWLGGGWIEYAGRLCWDMAVPDVYGLKTIIISKSYNLEAKRSERDARRGVV